MFERLYLLAFDLTRMNRARSDRAVALENQV